MGNIFVKNIFKCVDRAKLTTVDLHLEPLASADAVLSDEEKEAGVVLVDIGGGTTDVAIFYDGIIRHTAVIPFGGNIEHRLRQAEENLEAEVCGWSAAVEALVIDWNSHFHFVVSLKILLF